MDSGLTVPVHVIPVGDVIGHERSEHCVCGPTKTKLARRDGTVVVAYAHMSLDGREFKGFRAA